MHLPQLMYSLWYTFPPSLYSFDISSTSYVLPGVVLWDVALRGYEPIFTYGLYEVGIWRPVNWITKLNRICSSPWIGHKMQVLSLSDLQQDHSINVTDRTWGFSSTAENKRLSGTVLCVPTICQLWSCRWRSLFSNLTTTNVSHPRKLCSSRQQWPVMD